MSSIICAHQCLTSPEFNVVEKATQVWYLNEQTALQAYQAFPEAACQLNQKRNAGSPDILHQTSVLMTSSLHAAD